LRVEPPVWQGAKS